MQQLLVDGYDIGDMRQMPQRNWGEQSEHAKAFAALADGQLQHPVHLLIRVICREAQLVETAEARGQVISTRHQEPGCEGWKKAPWEPARHQYVPCVRCGQRVMGGSSNDLERGAEGSEASRGQLRGACCELKQPSQLLLGEAGNHCPKPPHDLAGRAQGSWVLARWGRRREPWSGGVPQFLLSENTGRGRDS